MTAQGSNVTHAEAIDKIIRALREEQEQVIKDRKEEDQQLAAEWTKAETRGLFLGVIWMITNLLLIRPIFAWINTKAFQDWNCFDAAKRAPERLALKRSGLEVIVASPNDWHTTSMQVALETLGLRTYKTMETSFYMNQLLKRDMHIEEVASALQACQVRAFMPHPWLDMLPGLIAASPGAKVILSTPDWFEWKRRVKSNTQHEPLGVFPHSYTSLAMSAFLCHWLPYGLLWPPADLGHTFLADQMTSLLFQHCNFLPFDFIQLASRWNAGELPGTKTFQNMQQNRSSFNQYLEDVQRLVPPGNVLHFDFKRHGWTELASFLDRPAPSDGREFPYVSTSSSSPEWAELALFPWTTLNFGAIMLASMLLNWLIFAVISGFIYRAWRRAQAKRWTQEWREEIMKKKKSQ